ncbi:hypothetical protein BLOT_008439 [Blomia tropicalis]|nr:hypothetical protein BLOT_008439 [Blomia tropicalis]
MNVSSSVGSICQSIALRSIWALHLIYRGDSTYSIEIEIFPQQIVFTCHVSIVTEKRISANPSWRIYLVEHGSLDSDSDEATFVVYSNRIHLKQEVAVVDGEEGR